MLIAFKSISQTSNSTIKDSLVSIPISQLRTAINTIERGKVVEQELIETKKKVVVQDKLINVKDSIIVNYAKKEAAYKAIVVSYDKTMENDKQMITNLKASLLMQKLATKKQKVSKWAVAILSLGLGYLIGK